MSDVMTDQPPKDEFRRKAWNFHPVMVDPVTPPGSLQKIKKGRYPWVDMTVFAYANNRYRLQDGTERMSSRKHAIILIDGPMTPDPGIPEWQPRWRAYGFPCERRDGFTWADIITAVCMVYGEVAYRSDEFGISAGDVRKLRIETVLLNDQDDPVNLLIWPSVAG